MQATTDKPKQAALKPDCKVAKQCVQHKLGIALRNNKLKCIEMLERKEKTTPFGVNLMRSPVTYWAAQDIEMLQSRHRTVRQP